MSFDDIDVDAHLSRREYNFLKWAVQRGFGTKMQLTLLRIGMIN